MKAEDIFEEVIFGCAVVDYEAGVDDAAGDGIVRLSIEFYKWARAKLHEFDFVAFRISSSCPSTSNDFNVWTTKKRIEKLRYMYSNPVTEDWLVFRRNGLKQLPFLLARRTRSGYGQ